MLIDAAPGRSPNEAAVAGVLRDSAPPARTPSPYGTLTDSAAALQQPRPAPMPQMQPPRAFAPQPPSAPQPQPQAPSLDEIPIGTPSPQTDELDVLTAQLAELPEPSDVLLAPPLI